DWPTNAIDYFVLHRLDAAGLVPSPSADRRTLVRRVYFDLLGLPPTDAQVEAFLNDQAPDAYARLVDNLLASPHYGQRWARPWLDLARYSDTNGYEKDRERTIWPFRDWVVEALNADMPFDEFSIQQLAGDMLPNPSQEHLVATGFHRNTMLNEEGGIDPLEYRFYSVVDRVATTGTVWLGLTTGCAQCHTHKYDPLSHTEYYQLMALLNNAEEIDLNLVSDESRQHRKTLEQQIDAAIAALPAEYPCDSDANRSPNDQLESDFKVWLQSEHESAARWQVIKPTKLASNLPQLETLDDGSVLSTGDITKRDVFELEFDFSELARSSSNFSPSGATALRLEVLPDDRLPAGGPGRAFYEGRKGDFFLSELTITANDEPVEMKTSSVSYGKLSIGGGSADAKNVFDGEGSTGWSVSGREGERHQLVVNFAAPLPKVGKLRLTLLFERHFAASLGRFRVALCQQTKDAIASKLDDADERELVLTEDLENLPDDLRSKLLRHYLLTTEKLAEARKPVDALRNKLKVRDTTMIFSERKPENPRETFRHHRGEYLSPREPVSGGVPEFLNSRDQQVGNRLEFARWLVSEGNPLVGRVVANRAWAAFWGRGPHSTPGDFGTQSPPPSHPDLLDWLACETQSTGWSQKRLHRLIVTSSTYRQSSHATAELIEQDPSNILMARGPRFRLPAEMVRDAMLRSSGLLTEKIGGPGVRPPQPQAVTAVAYGNPKWNTTSGENRYRRSLYTFAKRTAPFAAFAIFDAPTGENCVARRDRSNTPLQALTLLNDAMYLEFAVGIAEQAVRDAQRTAPTVKSEPTAGTGKIVELIFRRILSRPPNKRERALTAKYFSSQLSRLQAQQLDASQILTNRPSSSKEDLEADNLAAWTLVARAIMNLDEAITKP
ncbi:MAG TPA: hypothetical protein DDW52_28390, partial [Planctomycetaceae bacterium]|nr:hypothetical protein [Planctomycetaceae bacterium]